MKFNEELKKLIEDSALAFATVNESGKPHCISVGFVKVVSDDEMLVTNNYMIETEKNILKNPNVALIVWNKEWEKNCFGYELTGTAECFTGGKWYETIKKMSENKGCPCKGAILIKISKIKKLA